MQRKVLLGGNKFISKVRLFTYEEGRSQYMVFYVDNPVSTASDLTEKLQVFVHAKAIGSVVDLRVVKRSEDGRNFVREHVFRLKI